MTDRELLDLAAKAAGYTKSKWVDARFYLLHEKSPKSDWQEWNPLENDGDALRLAVKLKMLVDVTESHAKAMTAVCGCQEKVGADANATTRRAIVRAAALIGRSMP
jgi:hypothetical protein